MHTINIHTNVHMHTRPYIAKDLAFSSGTSARITAVGTASLCVSKLIMGPVVDIVGGKKSALATLLNVSTALLYLGFVTSSTGVGKLVV